RPDRERLRRVPQSAKSRIPRSGVPGPRDQELAGNGPDVRNPPQEHRQGSQDRKKIGGDEVAFVARRRRISRHSDRTGDGRRLVQAQAYRLLGGSSNEEGGKQRPNSAGGDDVENALVSRVAERTAHGDQQGALYFAQRLDRLRAVENKHWREIDDVEPGAGAG